MVYEAAKVIVRSCGCFSLVSFRRGLLAWAVLGMVATLVIPRPVLADDSADGVIKQIITAQEKLGHVNRRIAKQRLLADQMSDGMDGQQRLNRLHELKAVYQRLLNVLKKSTNLEAERSRLEKAAESGQAVFISETKPYSLTLYDSTLDELAALNQEQSLLQASQKNTQVKLDQSREALEKAEQAWRRVKEEANNQDRLAAVELDRELAEATVQLAGRRLKDVQEKLDLVVLKRNAADQKLNVIREDLAFDPASLEKVMAGIDERKQRAGRYLQETIEAQKRLENQWQKDQRGGASQRVMEKADDAREAWRQTYEAALQRTEEMNQLLDRQQQLWGYRHALLKGDVASKDLTLWESEATAIREQVRQSVRAYQTGQVTLHARMDTMEKELTATQSMAARIYAGLQLDALKKVGAIGQDYLSLLLETEQLTSRLLDEIQLNAPPATLWDRVADARSRLDTLWNFELWVVDERGVTVGKVITALGILIIGMLLIKWISHLIVGRMRKAHLEPGSAAAVEKMLYYLGFLVVLLFALKTVNIPLTAFTFLGGAFAIGFGFGAQNLINNFISGFIIMAERPIKIGDILELGDQCVRVEAIGARCTRVRTGENIHMLVPNSSFLENDITNWTLADKRIRAKVSVGVAYGSPVEKVTELLMESTQKVENIHKDPKPFVIFDEFGDNALAFEIYFWIRVENVIEKKKIASRLRYEIYSSFGDNNIEISFPQRDIHLDTVSPVQIELLKSTDGKAM